MARSAAICLAQLTASKVQGKKKITAGFNSELLSLLSVTALGSCVGLLCKGKWNWHQCISNMGLLDLFHTSLQEKANNVTSSISSFKLSVAHSRLLGCLNSTWLSAYAAPFDIVRKAAGSTDLPQIKKQQWRKQAALQHLLLSEWWSPQGNLFQTIFSTVIPSLKRLDWWLSGHSSSDAPPNCAINVTSHRLILYS